MPLNDLREHLNFPATTIFSRTAQFSDGCHNLMQSIARSSTKVRSGNSIVHKNLPFPTENNLCSSVKSG